VLGINQTAKKIELAKLWEQYSQTKDLALRETLILQYVPLVKYVADRIAIGLPNYLDKGDLINYGILGLIEALERFNLNRGVKFETYALARIRGSIFDGLNTMDWFPASLRAKMRKLEKAYSFLENELGRPAKDEEVAAYLEISEQKLDSLLLDVSYLTLISLDEILPNGDSDNKELTLKDSLQDEKLPSLTANLEFVEVKNILAKSINKLPAQEKMLISLYYYEGLTMKEISQVMEVSNSRISQLHSKAVLRLRGSLSRLKSSLFG